jgi:glycerol-3-phosphate O-acyltransferase/dihydroxyacetone phosphate acyltransferase
MIPSYVALFPKAHLNLIWILTYISSFARNTIEINSGADRSAGNIDFTKTQLGVLVVTMLLAVDHINPVKIFLHVFPAIAPWHIVTVSMLFSLYIWISEFKALLYFSVKIFFQSILSIFFRDVEIIGRDNIPRHGPIIFTVNHANQFIDAVTVLCTCQQKISYLMAETSWKRRIIGDLAWALDVVPVMRAQDAAIKGSGQVVFAKDESTRESDTKRLLNVKGTDTLFTQQLAKGDKIRPEGTSVAVTITEIVTDTSLLVDASMIPDDDNKVFDTNSPVSFDILKHVNQQVVFAKVLDKLATGGCIGIFPEGGSHDRTDLLPLKVGVALIAYSALEKDALNIPIVPVGLNYFQAHRWRGRAVVEYGKPIYLNPSTLHAYKAGGQEKFDACNELLGRIQDSMKSVLVSTPDYDTLQLIHTARRLYQRRGLQGQEKQDLSRRFAEGYKRLLEITEGDPPEE